MRCPNPDCDGDLRPGDRHCPLCGTAVDEAAPVQPAVAPPLVPAATPRVSQQAVPRRAISREGEAYPALRASEQFTRLATELVAAEELILLARFKFNEAVAGYNRYIRQFPTLLFARAMAIRDRDYITA